MYIQVRHGVVLGGGDEEAIAHDLAQKMAVEIKWPVMKMAVMTMAGDEDAGDKDAVFCVSTGRRNQEEPKLLDNCADPENLLNTAREYRTQLTQRCS